MPNYTTGVLLALFSATGFATLPILIKMAYDTGLSTNSMLTIRFALSALLLFFTLKIRGISPFVPARQAGILFLLGSLGFASTSVTFTESLRYLSASLTSVVFHIYPSLVAILSFLKGDEHPKKTTFCALLLCFIGLLLVVGLSFSTIDIMGISLAIASALLYALYAVAGHHVRSNVNSLIVTFYICIGATFIFALSGIIHGDLSFQLSLTSWFVMLCMALFATLIGIFGFFTAMSRIGATKTCIISTAEPLITVLLAFILLGEHMDFWQLIGGLLIASSIIILQL